MVPFKVTDGGGKPLELNALDANSVKFTLAVLKAGKGGEGDYQNYLLSKVVGKNFVFRGETRKPALSETLQPDTDQAGSLARLGARICRRQNASQGTRIGCEAR